MKRMLLGVVLLATGCGAEAPAGSDEATAAGAAAPAPVADGEVVVAMEGETLTVPKVDWRVSTIENVEGERRYMLMADGSPLTLNLNVKDGAIPASFPATFTVPADNNPNIRIDLNFFNTERDSKRMQKRIIFSEGTIEVRAMSDTALDISFNGRGHPLMKNKEMFAIEGSANAAK
jgi:hypothetical protein